MSSLLPGYEYDIFISYRQKDNKYDGWVTGFVANLTKELEATFKEDISIYFDENPQDGLLENHQVDKSLQGKLKCLIFIPIISQTYCDPKSFAWQHEFCAFNRLAQADSIGSEIKLGSRNVASRILPIRIHDLDAGDKALLESELGGVLRAIDFTFKSPGVNRSLTPADRREENTNKTVYRDQVNKVANAVKEIIAGIRYPQASDMSPGRQISGQRPAQSRRKPFFALAFLAALLTAGYFLYTGYTGDSASSEVDKSIAVLPFDDMSPGQDQEYFGDGIADEIISTLNKVEELKVIARTSSFQFKGKSEDLASIAEKLGVATILQGSVKKSGDQFRITAQLIRASDEKLLWQESFTRSVLDALAVQDEIAMAVARQLQLKLSGNLKNVSLSTNLEARLAYQQGRFLFDRNGTEDRKNSLHYFRRATELDSTFAIAWAYYANLKINSLREVDANTSALGIDLNNKALRLNPGLAEAYINRAYIELFNHNIAASLQETEHAYLLDSRNAMVLRNLGLNYVAVGRLSEAIEMCKKAIELDPIQPLALSYLAYAYYFSGDPVRADSCFRKRHEISPTYRANLSIDNFVDLTIFGSAKALERSSNDSNEISRLFGSAIALAATDRPRALDSLLKLERNYSAKESTRIALAHAHLGDEKKALAWLEKDFSHHTNDLAFIKVYPQFSSIRNDPRFVRVLERMNFPK